MTVQRLVPHRVADAVTVHSMGGLGNQLFIYAAGTAAARAAGARLRVDVGQHAARLDRPALLEQLGLPAEYVDLGLRAGSSRITRRLGRSVGAAAVPEGCMFRERGFTFQQAALAQPHGSCLFGYFQSWRYVDPVASDIRAELDLVAKARAVRLNPLVPAVADHSSITLHVRRGDYLDARAGDYHGVAGADYYRTAVTVLRRMGYDGPLQLFSDDVLTARMVLSDLGEVRTFDQAELDAVDEMLLMSRAAALVTANSSFSWWAGWLGDSPDRPVISPRPWFDDPNIDSRDLLPPHWLSLDRR